MVESQSRNPAARAVQQRASELQLAEISRTALRDFFEKEKSNETKLPCSYVNEHVRVFVIVRVLDCVRLHNHLHTHLLAILTLHKQGESINKSIDWFDVIPCLAHVPKTEVRNMASKLCIQLHSFPKTLFQKIQITELVTGQSSFFARNLWQQIRLLTLTQARRVKFSTSWSWS